MKQVLVILLVLVLITNVCVFGQATINRADIPEAMHFYMPIGDRNAIINNDLVWSTGPDHAHNTYLFLGDYYDDQGVLHSGWYSYVNFNNNKTYDSQCYTGILPECLDYHPGEDWNGNGGANTELGEPVYAIGAGRVIYTQLSSAGFGNMVQIVHRLPSGIYVLSVYAHLNQIFVSQNDLVSIGTRIGTVGNSGTGAAHLHWEIRRESFLNLIDSYTVSLKNQYPYTPNTWPGFNTLFIADNYYSPSEFIKGLPTPCIIGSVETHFSQGVVVSGDYAYVGDDAAGLKVVDISNPANPIIVGSVYTHRPWKVVVSGNYVYLADGAAGLKVVDISNPANPIIVGILDTDGLAYEVAMSGNYAYVADLSSGIKVVDITNPTNPTVVGSVDTYYAYSIFVYGQYAYVADGWGGLKLVDIHDPINPVIVGVLNINNTHAFEVFVYGVYAYVAAYNIGIQVVDITNPINPSFVGLLETDGPRDIFVLNDYIYLADGSAGFHIIKKHCLSANFTASRRFGYSPLAVQFTDQSTGNPTSWYWDFGDGVTSTEQNPKHTYIGGENRTVSLNVSDGSITNTKTMEHFITVRVKNFKDDPKVELVENYPNPFNPSTTISYSLPTSQHVSLVVYNILGQTVTTLVDGMKEAGEYSAIWDGRNDNGSPVSSGIYFYRLTTADTSLVRKMLLLK